MDDQDRILAYLHGRLPEADRARFEADLADRPGLRAEVAAMQAARSVMEADRPDAATRSAGWARLSQSMAEARTGTPANLNRPPRLLQLAATAVIAIAVWQFLAVPFLPGARDTGFVPASSVAQGAVLRVAFAASATWADVSALLADTGARVTDGPGALGLFTLEFADPAARDSAETALRARPDLVTAVSRP